MQTYLFRILCACFLSLSLILTSCSNLLDDTSSSDSDTSRGALSITNISLDHTDILGDTICAIAKEKAGIIRRSIPVVSTAVHPDASRVIVDKARAQRTKILLLNRDFAINQIKNIKQDGDKNSYYQRLD